MASLWRAILFTLLLLTAWDAWVEGANCNYNSDFTDDTTCTSTRCSNSFRSCRCQTCTLPLAGAELFSISGSWSSGNPVISSTGKTAWTDTNNPASYCLNWGFSGTTMTAKLYRYVSGSCVTGTNPIWSNSVQITSVLGNLTMQFVGSQATSTAVSSLFSDFIDDSYNSECLIGNIEVPPGIGTKMYKIGGPFACGFQFSSIKIELDKGATFKMSFDTYTGQTCSNPNLCQSIASLSSNTSELLLVPKVSCMQPCVIGKDGNLTGPRVCMTELGYENRFPRTPKISGSAYYNDMGYQYVPPYNNENGIVNIMWPTSCASLKSDSRIKKSANGNIVLLDSDYNCNPATATTTPCSLVNFVRNYNQAPSTLWSTDNWSDLAIIQRWREEFGWNYTSSSVSTNGNKGYIGFRGQPISFAPGKRSSVVIIPIQETDNFCWVLGVSFLDICSGPACRSQYDVISCVRSSGFHALYTHFYTELRIGQQPGYNNFLRTNHIGYSAPIDNAWRFHFWYYFQPLQALDSRYGINAISHHYTPLPSPCMASSLSAKYFILESYESDCGDSALPPCPGGLCNPIISYQTATAATPTAYLRMPYALPGSGCRSSVCSTESSLAGIPSNGDYINGTRDSWPDKCQCAWRPDGWVRPGSCQSHSCWTNAESTTNRSWYYCATNDPIISGLTGTTCGCNVAECNQAQIGSCGNQFGPDCTTPKAFSGNTQRTLWKINRCSGSSCGPQYGDKTGLRGCTTTWMTQRCNYYPLHFVYACTGSTDEEKQMCADMNRNNYGQGLANDIRDMLTANTDIVTWKRGNTQGTDNSFDPDADGLLGWTQQYYCATTGQYVNVPSCTLNYGCSPTVTTNFPHLYNQANDATSEGKSCGCCGNGVCEPMMGEDCYSCPFDCKWYETSGAPCCGQVHTESGVTGTCAAYVCRNSADSGKLKGNGQGVTCNSTAVCTQRKCWHCSGDRVPTRAAIMQKADGSYFGGGCDAFPVMGATCVFEETQLCLKCSGTGSNDGCGDGQICDFSTCTCVSNCTYQVDCTTYQTTCPEGMKPCPSNTGVCQGRDCVTGSTTCCYPCSPTYGNLLVNTSTTVCDTSSYSSCCPAGRYPDSSRCDCLNCTSAILPNLGTQCVCNRCDASSLFVTKPGGTQSGSDCQTYASVNLFRYNPYGCNCAKCDPVTCPAGQVLFPPPTIKICDNVTRDAVWNWIKNNMTSTDCPVCMNCNYLYSLGLLIPQDSSSLQGGLCEYQDPANPCSCRTCANPCGMSFPLKPTYQQWLDFMSNQTYYTSCFQSDWYCNYTAGQIRSSSNVCQCGTCQCPTGYKLNAPNANPCNFANCVPCTGKTCDQCDPSTQQCVRTDNGTSLIDCTTCNCDCAPCTFKGWTCGGDQYSWYKTSLCNNSVCQSCKTINNCPALGMAYNTSDYFGCSCIPCNETNWGTPSLPKCSKYVNTTLSYYLYSNATACQCDACVPLTTCSQKCNTKLRLPDRCACVPCNSSAGVDACQYGWTPEVCGPYQRYETTKTDQELIANNCSHCFPCSRCLIDNYVCNWRTANQTCGYQSSSCPSGQRMLLNNATGLPVLDGLGCPSCYDPYANCPCAYSENSTHFTIGFLPSACADCTYVTYPKQIVNFTQSRDISNPCKNATKLTPCNNPCNSPSIRQDPNDTCKCVPCSGVCPVGQYADPANTCNCLNCTCASCYSAITANSSILCNSNGCVGCTNSANTTSPNSCANYYYCNPANLCSPLLLTCQSCDQRYPGVANSSFVWVTPKTSSDYNSIVQNGLCNPSYTNSSQYCSTSSGFCTLRQCTCSKTGGDCYPQLINGSWYYCTDGAYCAPLTKCSKSCTGFEFRNGTQGRLSPKTQAQVDSNPCNSTNVCECNWTPCTCSTTGSPDCQPYLNGTGYPFACSANQSYCTESVKACPDCRNATQRFKTRSEVKNLCDSNDICSCVPCVCGKDCTTTSTLDGDGRTVWSVCDSSALCSGPSPCDPTCPKFSVISGKEYAVTPRSSVPTDQRCNKTYVCECEYDLCTCGESGTDDCEPYWNSSTPYYCTSTNYCTVAPQPCVDCTNGTQRFKTRDEVTNVCDSTEVCSCVPCVCGDDCTPYFANGTWYYCDPSDLCGEPQQCPDCDTWASDNNVPFDPDNEYWLARTDSYPTDVCGDACACQKESCIQECSPRLGEATNSKTCGACDNCTVSCDPGYEWDYVRFYARAGDNMTTQCADFWSQPEVTVAYSGEQNDVNLEDICTLRFGGAVCSCVVSMCSCRECEACELCEENVVGGCFSSPSDSFNADTMMYYRPDACADCVLCDACVSNETHIRHRDVTYCNEAGADCYLVDSASTACSGYASICNDPCNCDLTSPCIPADSPDNLLEDERYCDGVLVQHNTTLSIDGNVQCTECIECVCDDSQCSYNEYIDTSDICGVTTNTISCGVDVGFSGRPCYCQSDVCDPCVSCPSVRSDIWEGATSQSTICGYSEMLEWNTTEWKLPESCTSKSCTDSAKYDDICGCNCLECSESYYLLGLCYRWQEAGKTVPTACNIPSTLTCNSFWQAAYSSEYFYRFNDTVCSCEVCGTTDYSHLSCDPYSADFGVTADGCDCYDCTDGSLCCPPDFSIGECDPAKMLRPNSTYCNCEPCPDECNVCQLPLTYCDTTQLDPYLQTLACTSKPLCVDSQPVELNCSGLVGIVPSCLSETDVVRDPYCHTDCEPCTGVLCTEDVRGNPIYGQRPVEGDLCSCEDCPLEYPCSENLTTVTLTDIILPEGLDPSLIVELLSSPEVGLGPDAYWNTRCNETCVPCSDDLCITIGEYLGVTLSANESNPCQCLSCPYDVRCPVCPWCDPTVPDCRCSYTVSDAGLIDVVCGVPDECAGLLPVSEGGPGCDFTPLQGTVNASDVLDSTFQYCYWDDVALPFTRDTFSNSDCTCGYTSNPGNCPPPVDICNATSTETCDPTVPCACSCYDPCHDNYCPPRTCQPDRCTFQCEPCPPCETGFYQPRTDIYPSDSTDPNANWLCSGDQCACVPCSITECPKVNEYFDPINCVCRPCTETCDSVYTGNNTLSIYVYPNVTDGSEDCTCLDCYDVADFDCEYECTNCTGLIVENNVCKCAWCLPDQYLGASGLAYEPEQCPLYSGVSDGTVNDTQCLCGIRPTNITYNDTVDDGGCPFDLVCGCCPTDYLNCIANNGTEDFCANEICVVQLDCNGECTGEPIYFDSCGVLCGNNECKTPEENNTIPVCLYVDLCNVCGGDGTSCMDCDNVPNGGAKWGVDCKTGKPVCGGPQSKDCPPPVVAVVVASVVGGAVGGVSLAILSVAAFFILAAILRRSHWASQITAEYDATLEDLMSGVEVNPLHEGHAVVQEVNLEADDLIDLE